MQQTCRPARACQFVVAAVAALAVWPAASHAQSAFDGAAALWRRIHRAHPRWKLLGADGVTYHGFTRRLSPSSARRTFQTAPTVAPEALPSSGRAFFARFRDRFGVEPDPYAINGYEAMALILDSIDRAANPVDRLAVIDAFFATRDRSSVLGRYSIDAFGDTTLPTYGSYRVDRRGRLVWDRVISLPLDNRVIR